MSRTDPSPVKILFYAINGTGLGHLSRLLAIAREARELLNAMQVRADFQFITTSEAPQIAWDFPVYKIPSKTIVAQSDTPNSAFVAGAKMIVSNLVASVRPDILVLDTVPAGSFQELVFLKDYAKKTAFVDRQKDPAVAGNPVNQSHLALYDLILVPDDECHARQYPIAAQLKGRRRFVGRIHGFDPEQALDRDSVCAQFNVDRRWLIYVSAGGGGDSQAESEINTMIESLAENPDHFILAGYGPLYRGRRIYRSNVIPLAEANASRYFSGVDIGISAAGYNTYEELLAAQVPSVFFPQLKGFDRQDQRIEHGEEQGWHLVLASLEPLLIQAAVENLKDETRRLAIQTRLADRGCSRGALRAAVELIALQSTLPTSTIERRQLSFVAACRSAWQPEYQSSFVDSFVQSWNWSTLSETATDLDNLIDLGRRAFDGINSDEWLPLAADRLRWGETLSCWRQRSGWSHNEFQRFLAECLKGATAATAAGRQRTLRNVLDELQNNLGDHAARFVMDVWKLSKQGHTLAALDAFCEQQDTDMTQLADRIHQLRQTLPHQSALTVDELIRQSELVMENEENL